MFKSRVLLLKWSKHVFSLEYSSTTGANLFQSVEQFYSTGANMFQSGELLLNWSKHVLSWSTFTQLELVSVWSTQQVQTCFSLEYSTGANMFQSGVLNRCKHVSVRSTPSRLEQTYFCLEHSYSTGANLY